MFGPQKGASPAQVEAARAVASSASPRCSSTSTASTCRPSRAAARPAGLAGGLAAVGAELVSGFDVVADEVDLDEHLEGADLVVTGEGFLDDESFDGKVVGGVASLAEAVGVPCLAVVGEVVEPLPTLPSGLTVVSLTERFGAEESMARPGRCAAQVVVDHLAALTPDGRLRGQTLAMTSSA